MGQLWRDEWRSSSCSRQQTTRDYWTLSAVLCSLISPNANCKVSGHCWSLATTRLLTGLANSLSVHTDDTFTDYPFQICIFIADKFWEPPITKLIKIISMSMLRTILFISYVIYQYAHIEEKCQNSKISKIVLLH